MPISITRGSFEVDFNSSGDVTFKSNTESNALNNGALVVSGGASIGKNINMGGSLTTIGEANFLNNVNISGFLNSSETTSNYFLNIVSGTSHTAKFDNSDVLFVALTSNSATTITVDVPEMTTGKWRNLFLYVNSNGNYTFNNLSIQGYNINWKSLALNTIGTQPTWSPSGTMDAHSFTFDGTKLYHLHTFQYIITIFSPSNLNYSTNTFELYTNENFSLIPTLSGTSPYIFSAQTPLPTGFSINSGTGVISGLRTTVLNNTNYTIRATNSSGFVERIINLGVNFSFGTINKGSATTINSDGSTGFTYYGFRKRTYVVEFFGTTTYPATGSLTNERFNNTNIEILNWNASSTLDLFIAGNISGTVFTLILGNQSFTSSTGNEWYVSDTSGLFGYPVPTTRYSWSISGGQFSYFQNTSPLTYKII